MPKVKCAPRVRENQTWVGPLRSLTVAFTGLWPAITLQFSQRRVSQLGPVALFVLLLALIPVALSNHHPAPKHQVQTSESQGSLDDFPPSDFRRAVEERREARHALPDVGEVELQEENQELASKLQQASEHLAQATQQLGELNQMVQSDQASLASLARQLGLPKDRLALPPMPAGKGVGAATAQDLATLARSGTPPAAGSGLVRSAGDLQQLVARYLNIPCPLPGDPICSQAIDHAKMELARGHGLDVNKPDALPTLERDVAQPFGPTDVNLEPLQMVNGQWVHFHDGVDLAANYGEPVMAAGAGEVVFAGTIPSGALAVEIAHADGLHSLYLHEEQLLVQAGQHVAKGQVIGLVGATGLATGPHVHFQINDATGQPIDPMPYLQ